MLLVHLANGRTESFDLQDASHAEKWQKLVKDASFQASIRGLSVRFNGVMYSLPRPVGFDRIFLFAEQLQADSAQKFKGGERLVCQADEVRVQLMVHQAQRATRVSLSKTGQQCYNPLTRQAGD